jgi:hypothetical protein
MAGVLTMFGPAGPDMMSSSQRKLILGGVGGMIAFVAVVLLWWRGALWIR